MQPVMTQEQRDFYEQNGYLVIPNALNAAELSDIRAAFDRADKAWLADPSRPGTRSPSQRQIVAIVEYDDTLLRLMAHPAVFSIVREIIGDDVAMIDNDGHVRLAGAVEPVCWHHDVTMANVYHPASTLMVKAFFLLTDVTGDGGPTGILPGSHRYPLDYTFPKFDNPEDIPGHVRMAYPAGTAYLFNGRVYHAPLNNHSAIDRRTVIFNYGHFWMKPRTGYEPSAALQARAGTPELRQLLHVGDAYTQRLSD